MLFSWLASSHTVEVVAFMPEYHQACWECPPGKRAVECLATITGRLHHLPHFENVALGSRGDSRRAKVGYRSFEEMWDSQDRE